jgi:hypothetical protein
MKVNIFFCNGFMSALASSFIADHLKSINPNSVSYLCIEQNARVEPIYYEVLDIFIEQNQNFEKVIKVKTECRDMSLRKPVEFIKNVSYYKNKANILADTIGESIQSEKIIIIWAPTTTRIWPFFLKKGGRFNLIEHGLGEYCRASGYTKASFKNKLMSYFQSLFGYSTIDRCDSIWLCSNAVKMPADKNIVQINFASLFIQYVDSFWHDYKSKFPVAAEELNVLAAQFQKLGSDVYLYLPSDEIRYEQYAQFARDQIVALGLKKNTTLVIKKHPGSVHADYGMHLTQYVNIINIVELENCNIPAEFIVKILNINKVVGSASSTLYYLNSWLPNVATYIYNDYDQKMLTHESRKLKKQLGDLGLINRRFKVAPGFKTLV